MNFAGNCGEWGRRGISDQESLPISMGTGTKTFVAAPFMSKLAVRGFRAIGPNEVALDLAPLTVIVGENGAGKSSLLQAIALTAQSALEDPRRTDLVLDGSRVELDLPEAKDPRSVYREIYFRKDANKPISVHIEWNVESGWPAAVAKPDTKWAKVGPWPPKTVGYGWSRRGIGWPSFSHRFTLNGLPLFALEGEVEVLSPNSAQPHANWIVGDGGYEFNSGKSAMRSPERVLDEEFTRLNVGALVADAAQRAYGDLEKVVRVVKAVAAYIRERLDYVSLVEPLRGKKLAHHDVGPEVSFVGPNGEMVVRFLNLIQNRARADFELLRRWAERFGMPGIEPGWGGGNQLKVAFRDPVTGTPLDLREAATGSYQTLLMAAQMLLSQKGSVILFEEPENNLHPKYEKLLPSMYADAVRTGHQVLVTTHSEMLVAAVANEVRRRSLEPTDVAVWELARDEKTGVTASRIRVTERGNLETWVRGFAAAERELFDDWKEAIPEKGTKNGGGHARSPRSRAGASGRRRGSSSRSS